MESVLALTLIISCHTSSETDIGAMAVGVEPFCQLISVYEKEILLNKTGNTWIIHNYESIITHFFMNHNLSNTSCSVMNIFVQSDTPKKQNPLLLLQKYMGSVFLVCLFVCLFVFCGGHPVQLFITNDG